MREPSLFACDEAGRLTAQIPDAQAELHDYELRLVRPGEPAWGELLDLLRERKVPAGTAPEWACVLLRLDTDQSHLVCRLPGRWLCECADWMYRSHKGPDGCKHCVFARAFWALTRAIAPQPHGAITP